MLNIKKHLNRLSAILFLFCVSIGSVCAKGLPTQQKGSASSGDYVGWAIEWFRNLLNFLTDGIGAIAAAGYVATLLWVWWDDKKDNKDLFTYAGIGIGVLVLAYFFLGESQAVFG